MWRTGKLVVCGCPCGIARAQKVKRGDKPVCPPKPAVAS